MHSTGGARLPSQPYALGAPAAPPQESDPYLAQAQGIVAQTQFEREVDRILDEAGAIGPIRDRLRYEATSFGPTLDLIIFAKYAAENVEALHVEEPMEDVLREFGAE